MPPPTTRLHLAEVRSGDPVGVVLTLGERAEAGYGERTSELIAAPALATLAAIEAFTPTAVSVELEWSDVISPAVDLPPIAVVMVRIEVAGVAMRYAGSVVVRDDRLDEAAARSVLQALNRRLEIMLG